MHGHTYIVLILNKIKEIVDVVAMYRLKQTSATEECSRVDGGIGLDWIGWTSMVRRGFGQVELTELKILKSAARP